jgi:hypothetical protein
MHTVVRSLTRTAEGLSHSLYTDNFFFSPDLYDLQKIATNWNYQTKFQNKKFWEELTPYFPFSTYQIFDTTWTA